MWRQLLTRLQCRWRTREPRLVYTVMDGHQLVQQLQAGDMTGTFEQGVRA